LKIALEQLLGGPCYHMVEVFGRPDDIPVWHAAVKGDLPDWTTFLADYRAAVDWPASAFWRELADANPDAVVLLSTRSSSGAWWKSANDTIFNVADRALAPDDDVFAAQRDMALDMFNFRFTPDYQNEAAAKAAYEAHNAEVRATIPADRLIDYRAGDGWGPICEKLVLPVPSEPFPHVNTTDEFRAMTGMAPLSDG
jgi:hypothetical protein